MKAQAEARKRGRVAPAPPLTVSRNGNPRISTLVGWARTCGYEVRMVPVGSDPSEGLVLTNDPSVLRYPDGRRLARRATRRDGSDSPEAEGGDGDGSDEDEDALLR